MTSSAQKQVVILVGPPGSGKNVIATHVAHQLKMTHINYRSVVINAGELAADKVKIAKLRMDPKPFDSLVAFEMLRPELDTADQGFILEGYPKSEREAQLLVQYLADMHDTEVTLVNIVTSHKVTKRRLSRRYVCPRCAYVIYDSQPDSLLDMRCMNCHIPLIRRSDDQDSEINARLERYELEAEGIIKVFSKSNNVVEIEGNEKLSFVISDILDHLQPITNQTIAERGARILIDGIGLNMADPNIIGTARRVASTMSELTHGYSIEAANDIEKNLSTRFPSSYSGMVILDPVIAVSLCSHHLLAVRYEVLFGYIPNEQSLGFSKIVKVIGLLAAKPVLQEDFTKEIMDVFEKALKSKGMIVVVRGQHSCMSIRGEKSLNSNITSDLRGLFSEDASMREQFFTLARQKSSLL